MKTKFWFITLFYSLFRAANADNLTNTFDLTEAKSFKTIPFNQDAIKIIEEKFTEIKTILTKIVTTVDNPNNSADTKDLEILTRLKEYRTYKIDEKFITEVMNFLYSQLPDTNILSIYKFILENCRLHKESATFHNEKIEEFYILQTKFLEIKEQLEKNLKSFAESKNRNPKLSQKCASEYIEIRRTISKLKHFFYIEVISNIIMLTQNWDLLTLWEKYWASSSDFYEENNLTKFNIMKSFELEFMKKWKFQLKKLKEDIKFFKSNSFKKLAKNKQLEEKIDAYFLFGKEIYSFRNLGIDFINKCKKYAKKHWKNNKKALMNLIYECERNLEQYSVDLYENEEINLSSPESFFRSIFSEVYFDIFDKLIDHLNIESFDLIYCYCFIKNKISEDLDRIPLLSNTTIKDIILHLDNKEYLRKTYSEYIYEHLKLIVHLQLLSCKTRYEFLLESYEAIIKVLNEQKLQNTFLQNDEIAIFLNKIYQMKQYLVTENERRFGIYEKFLLE